jgi:uncharacterized membrane protein
MTRGEKIYLVVMLLGPLVLIGTGFVISANPGDFVPAPEHGFGYLQLMLMALLAVLATLMTFPIPAMIYLIFVLAVWFLFRVTRQKRPRGE